MQETGTLVGLGLEKGRLRMDGSEGPVFKASAVWLPVMMEGR